MPGRFLLAREIEAEAVPFGAARWLSNPSATAASKLAVVDVTLDPDAGHAFHHHPRQEEVLYVVSGVVEQWLEKEKRLLGPGDGIFIPPGVVHASFNAGDGPARFIAILGPCVGAAGYEAIEVADRAPWISLR